MEKISSRLRELVEEVDQILDAGAAKAGDAPDAALEGLHRAREHLRHAYDAVRGRALALDRAVHDNPWRVIAATGVVAFLLGMLVRRR
jgi:ElaB/YqjD/DUF883 family membrane-anchored ribosome-binding protein